VEVNRLETVTSFDIRGRTLFTAAGNRFRIFDVTDPTEPVELSQVVVGPESGGFDSIAVIDRELFVEEGVMCFGSGEVGSYECGDTIREYDIADLGNPALVWSGAGGQNLDIWSMVKVSHFLLVGEGPTINVVHFPDRVSIERYPVRVFGTMNYAEVVDMEVLGPDRVLAVTQAFEHKALRLMDVGPKAVARLPFISNHSAAHHGPHPPAPSPNVGRGGDAAPRP
jgi:hypothetical protein